MAKKYIGTNPLYVKTKDITEIDKIICAELNVGDLVVLEDENGEATKSYRVAKKVMADGMHLVFADTEHVEDVVYAYEDNAWVYDETIETALSKNIIDQIEVRYDELNDRTRFYFPKNVMPVSLWIEDYRAGNDLYFDYSACQLYDINDEEYDTNTTINTTSNNQIVLSLDGHITNKPQNVIYVLTDQLDQETYTFEIEWQKVLKPVKDPNQVKVWDLNDDFENPSAYSNQMKHGDIIVDVANDFAGIIEDIQYFNDNTTLYSLIVAGMSGENPLKLHYNPDTQSFERHELAVGTKLYLHKMVMYDVNNDEYNVDLITTNSQVYTSATIPSITREVVSVQMIFSGDTGGSYIGSNVKGNSSKHLYIDTVEITNNNAIQLVFDFSQAEPEDIVLPL